MSNLPPPVGPPVGPPGPPMYPPPVPAKRSNTVWIIVAVVLVLFCVMPAGCVGLVTVLGKPTTTTVAAAPATTRAPNSSTEPSSTANPSTTSPPTTAASTTTASPTTTAAPTTTAPPDPAAIAVDIVNKNLSGKNRTTAAVDPFGVLRVDYKPDSIWDEVQAFHSAFYDASKIVPKLFGDRALANVGAVCLRQVSDFTSPLGESSEDTATEVCLTREVAAKTNFDGTTPDRLYFYARTQTWPADGLRFYVSPALLKNIKFE